MRKCPIRMSSRWRDLLTPAVGYLLLAVWVLGANPFRGETVAPMDLLTRQAGWPGVNPDNTVTHGERSDILDTYLPRWISVRTSLREGGNPFWIREPAGGVPGVHHFTNGTLTPSFWIFAAVDPPWLGYYLGNGLRLWLSGLGMYLFLRLALRRTASAFGGAVYLLSAFQAAWFFWPQTTTSMWIPWVLWAAGGWGLRGRKVWLPALTLTSALLMLGGFPSVALYAFYALAVWMAVLLPLSRPSDCLKIGTWALTAVALAALLAAIPALSLAELLEKTDLSYRIGRTSHRFPESLRLFWDPGHFRVETHLYMGKVLLFLIPLSLWSFRRGTAPALRKLTGFGWAAGILSFLVVFGLVPGEWMGRIPGFSFNPWARMAVVLGLALAVLGAAAVHHLQTWIRNRAQPVWRGGLAILLLVVITLQLADQTRAFRRFNAVTPADWFYPETPTLTHVRENLRPLQSVIADDSYLVSGTVAAYGVPEWFAHGFRFPVESRLLGRLVNLPFATPTAAYFNGNAIRLESHLHATFGIRYLLVREHKWMKHRLDSRPLLSHPPGPEMTVSPSIPAHRVEQTLRLPGPSILTGISMILHTHRQLYAQAPPQVLLLNAKGTPVARGRVGRRQAMNDQTVYFWFPEPVSVPAGTYRIQLGTTVPSPHPVSAWTSPLGNSDTGHLLIDGVPRERSLVYTLLVSAEEPGPWIRHDLEDGLVLLENREAPPSGAWFSEDPEGTGPIPAPLSSSWREGQLRIDLSEATAGFVVVPIRNYPGMRWQVNGRPVDPESYLGVLPAVPVSGPAEITMTYVPTAFRLGLPLTLAGLLGFTVLTGYAFRADRLWQAKHEPAPAETGTGLGERDIS